jgi:signal transduction histidine kinase
MKLSSQWSNLRFKTLLIIGLTLIGLITLLFLASSKIVVDSFIKVEQQDVVRNVQRVTDAIADEQGSLEAYSKAYSQWDDTIEFIERGRGKSQEINSRDPYIISNITDATYASERNNLFVFLNDDGQLVWGDEYDLVHERRRPISTSLSQHLLADDPLLRHDGTDDFKNGFLLTENGPMYLASQPLVNSDGEGPISGTVITGRDFDDERVEAIAKKTHLEIKVLDLNQNLPAEFAAAHLKISDGQPIYVQPLSDTEIAGYAIIRDFANRPILILGVQMPRDIFKQGLAAQKYLFAALTIIGIIFIMLALMIIERLVLTRLSHLARHVRAIGSTGNLQQRVHVGGGHDELVDLADIINWMLNRLNAADEALREEKAGVERKVVERTQDLQRAKDQIEKLYARDKEVQQLKDRFITIASHELRTPLTEIKSGLDLVQREALPALDQDALRVVQVGTVRLTTLVEELVYLASLEEGKLKPALAATELKPLIEGLCSSFEIPARSKGLKLDVKIEPKIGTYNLDARMIRQAVSNLIDNAIKFSDRGQITVGVAPAGPNLEISVQDTGPGISPADQHFLFEEFSRIQEATQAFAEGHGLGLYFAKLIAQAHRGRISVTTSPQGSRFTIQIPTNLEEDQAIHQAA